MSCWGGTEKAIFEQDFLLQKEADIVPVEVKAGGNVRSQSLKAFCDKYKPAAAIRFSGETLRLTGRGTVSAFYRLFAKLLAGL